MADRLLDAATAFFADFSKNAAPACLLTYFSTTQPIAIQHAPAFFPDGRASRMSGANAIRSYFDLITAHFTRAPLVIKTIEADTNNSAITVDASIVWTWRRSHRRWREDLICTIRFDEAFKIVSLNLETVSEPETCVMHAVDPPATDTDI
ncbi:hypothetical protein AX15_003756 [Amanita polypyramis BW_CC]|nr:hypothetical protein AX15_003756 [Amanita polypyramis BW_CC]